MKRHIDYVVVNVNGGYANVYDFCTPETAEEIIEKATEQARKTVETYRFSNEKTEEKQNVYR